MNKKYIYIISVFVLMISVTACSDSSTGVDDQPVSEVEVNTYQDLNAVGDTGHYTFFSFEEGGVLSVSDSATTDWDLAFLGTSVITNSGVNGPGDGGAVILDVPFEEVSIAPENGYAVDTDDVFAIPKGSGNGWYIYTGGGNPPNAILPMENKTIIIKTGDGEHYAKIEILSYYEGNPDTGTPEFADFQTRPEARYYTFRYAFQKSEGIRELK